MNVDSFKKKLEDCLKNGETFLIKQAFTNVPDWDQFIKMIDFVDSDEYLGTKTRNEKISMIFQSLYLRVADVFNISQGKNAGNIMPKLDEVIHFCNQIFGTTIKYSEAYINLKTKSEDLKPHFDDWTAVVWGCIGQMEWRIYNDFYNKKDELDYVSYIVNPGDIFIVPKGVAHKVIALTPRASISLAY